MEVLLCSIIDGSSPNLEEHYHKMSPELEGQGFSKKLGSAKKNKQRIRSSKPSTSPGQSAVRHEMVGHSGAAMSRFSCVVRAV